MKTHSSERNWRRLRAATLTVAPEVVLALSRVGVAPSVGVGLCATEVANVGVEAAVDEQVVVGIPAEVALADEVRRVLGVRELLGEQSEFQGKVV